MNKRQLQVQKSLLKDELEVIKELEKSYKVAIKDINGVIAGLLARKDTENIQSIIYQVKYQTELKKELEGLLDALHKKNFKTIDDYLKWCYKNAHIGTLFDLNGQGVPFLIPLDQEQMISAITLNSKLSAPLYNSLGYNVDTLKVNVRQEISRGIAQSLSYQEIARNIKNITSVDYNKSLRIAKTEGHRIQQEATYNAQKKAIQRGADVVKQWDSTLDGKTRPTHRELDGQIVGVDEYFKNSNGKALYPSGFGIASEDCNCRCVSNTRAKWSLDGGAMSKMNGFTNEIQFFNSTDDYDKFKKSFWSKENINYMNFISDMENKYGTKDFNKLLSNMSEKEYKKFKTLEEVNNK